MVSRMISTHLNSLPAAADTGISATIAGMNPDFFHQEAEETVDERQHDQRADRPVALDLLVVLDAHEQEPDAEQIIIPPSTVGKYPGPMRSAEPNG